MESSILSEVDDTSILRTGLSTCYWCPLDWQPASRLLPPRSGLERSDFVPWHFATHSAAIKSRPLWRRTGNERTHGLSHLDALCLALDLTVSNVVHPSTV